MLLTNGLKWDFPVSPPSSFLWTFMKTPIYNLKPKTNIFVNALTFIGGICGEVLSSGGHRTPSSFQRWGVAADDRFKLLLQSTFSTIRDVKPHTLGLFMIFFLKHHYVIKNNCRVPSCCCSWCSLSFVCAVFIFFYLIPPCPFYHCLKKCVDTLLLGNSTST